MILLAGIGKKCSKNVAFSVKTCRYRQENAAVICLILASLHKITIRLCLTISGLGIEKGLMFFCTYV
jgi:hypothetical protein